MTILLENLTHVYAPGTSYEKKALDRVHLEIAAGEIVGLIGPTGSGKSTLIQHLNGLLKPTSGRIQVQGVDLGQAKGSQLRQIRQQLGLVFQFPEEQLFEETVFDDIAFGPRNLGVPEDAILARVYQAMNTVGLDYEALRQRSPFQLSGGQMRRVAIAGVLAMRPKILVLDEPTAGLDPQGRDELLRQLRTLWQKQKMTVIIVSHLLEEVAEIAQRIVVMHQGQIFLDGPPQQVFAEASKLQDIDLGLPWVTKLCLELKARGWPLTGTAITEAEAAQEIAEYWTQKRLKE